MASLSATTNFHGQSTSRGLDEAFPEGFHNIVIVYLELQASEQLGKDDDRFLMAVAT